jgi:hypothetical protein
MALLARGDLDLGLGWVDPEIECSARTAGEHSRLAQRSDRQKPRPAPAPSPDGS